MENNNQQFNEENAKQLSKTLGALGMALVLIANKANPNDIGLKKEDIANFLKAIDQSKNTYDIFKELSEVWDQVEVSKEEEVVRIYNEVGNKFAISTDGIGESIKRSAGALMKSETLFEAANMTVRDPIKVGKALRIISLRLHGLDEDSNRIEGLKEEIENKLNTINLSLVDDTGKQKSLFKVVSELNSVWNDLNDYQRADVLELIAGKLNGNIIYSMILNFDLALEAYDQIE
ncbi:hypothetical protein [Paenibacillus sp. O199]|uniref:hypothetical protein n=1 Tax=Paenibacillus sp. O199 TaxID=1643925 RepID=UPI0007BF64DF|nr:hypothetical protein [Paenibacillus sp. O199]